MDVFKDNEPPSHGFVSNLIMVLFQPGEFFRTLTLANKGRQWLVAAMLILALVAFNAIQLTSQSTTTGDTGALPPDFMGGDGGFPFDMPFPGDGPGGTPAANPSDPAATWMTGLTAAGALIVQWGLLAILLTQVTMFNGRRPRIGANLQIVVWASMPLAVMAIVQTLFLSAGGTISKPGFTGFLDDWEAYMEFNIYVRSFVHALASQLTLFWLWHLALIYIGARKTLRGRYPIVILTLAIWVAVLGIGHGFQSYQTLSKAGEIPAVMEPVDGAPYIEEFFPEDNPAGEMRPLDAEPGVQLP
jgi:hypothetical protein